MMAPLVLETYRVLVPETLFPPLAVVPSTLRLESHPVMIPLQTRPISATPLASGGSSPPAY